MTGALVIGTGAVWLGAEIVDNWDAISETASEAWDAGTDLLGDVADISIDSVVTKPAEFVADGIGSVASGVGDLVSDWF